MPTRGSFFSPPSQNGKPSPLLADNIDPKTRDFKSLFVGADPVDAAVQVAVTTTRGSGPSVQNVGLRLTNTKLTGDFQSVTESDMRLALNDLVQRGDIAISEIGFGVDSNGKPTGQVNESDSSAQIDVSYINLRAFDDQVRRIPLGQPSLAALVPYTPPTPPSPA